MSLYGPLCFTDKTDFVGAMQQVIESILEIFGPRIVTK